MNLDDLPVDVETEEPVAEPRGKRKRAWSYPEVGDPRPEREPLTEDDWARVLRWKKRTVVFLVAREQRDWAGSQARSCGECGHVKLHGDPRRGFCVAQDMMTGLTFPVLCRKFEAAA